MASVEAAPQPLVQQIVLPTQTRGNYRRPHRSTPARNPQNRHPGTRPPPTPGDQHNNPAAPSHDPSLAFRPASAAPVSQSSPAVPSSAEDSAAESRAASISRGGARNTQRGPRGGRRGGAVRGRGGQANNSGNPEARHVTGTLNGNGNAGGGHLPASRQFGGRLTTPAESGESASHPSSILSADAPEFRPGQQHHGRARNVHGSKKVPAAQRDPHPRHAHNRRDSSLKSIAPDIATRTHEDISNGLYECPICTSEVERNSRVWSCKTCWTVFHLSCIKKWSANEVAGADEYKHPQYVTKVAKKDRNVEDPARPRSIVDDMSVANVVALASAKHRKDKPRNVNYVHLEHLGPSRMKSKPNIYVPGLVDDLSNAAITPVPNFVTKAHAGGVEKLSSMS
ncbi:MAG: hypothetical protein Q9208_001929 [Pyrenodesmia sp. 3 TL-2023]